MNRAHTNFLVKRVNEDLREITGTASTPSVDRAGDILLPEGAVFSLPLPLLWQHRTDAPIGHVTHAEVTKKGITIRAKIVKLTDPSPLRDVVESAWAAIKARLVGGLSVGFRSLDSEPIPGKHGVLFRRWEILEISAVTVAANSEAAISSVRGLRSAGSVARSDPFAQGARALDGSAPHLDGSVRLRPDAPGRSLLPKGARSARPPKNIGSRRIW